MSALMDDESLEETRPSLPEPVKTEAVDVLLDFGDFSQSQPASSTLGSQSLNAVSSNSGGPSVDLLADLFGTTTMNSGGTALQPEMKPNSVPQLPKPSVVPQSAPVNTKGKNILDDLDLFGNDITSTVRGGVQIFFKLCLYP
jgi:hypothetical protein